MKISFLFSLFICLQFMSFSQEKLSVYYDFNSSVLNADEEIKLQNITNKSIQISRIVAYTDTFGTKKYNLDLAEKRMNAVENYLLSKNIKVYEKKVLGENYDNNEFAIKNYKSWRRVDIYYFSGPINVPQEHFAEPIVVEKKQIIEQIIEEPEKKSSEEKYNDLLASETPKIVALDVKFYGGVDEMIPSSLPDLQSFYKFLNDNPSVNILIRGHVCCMDDYNLSVKRAKAVYNYLINKGIDKSRLSYKGFSNSVPVASPELSEEDMSKNRRVDIEIVK
ncbi:MAG: OmpA family protein [Flavobacteriia bacterium]|jgi:outer membrane protein OmpA-like peptidoglycan-associated protein